MKTFALLAFIAGAAVATLLLAHFGFTAVWRILVAFGWTGFAVTVAFHLVLVLMMGTSWWVLGGKRPDAGWGRYVWGRLVRDGAAEVLPLSQVGGFVAGARAAALAGIKGSFAAASTVVDLTMELMGQLAYTALGLGLLAWVKPGNAIVAPVVWSLAGMTVLASIFLLVQARGAGLVERLALRLAREWLGSSVSQSPSLQEDIHAMHGARSALLLSASLHFICWGLSGIEAWITLRFMGIHLSVAAAVIIDSLLYGVRSFAFMVPNAWGVQEAGYVLFGALFGLGPEAALALSLIRRGRDILIGAPGVLAWQMAEAGRVWKRAATKSIDMPT